MTRAVDIPIGRVACNGYGVPRLAARVHWYVLYEGPQTVFVDDAGRVLCIRADGLLDRRLLVEHADWCVGTFQSGNERARAVASMRSLIADNLMVRVAELRKAAA